MAGDSSPNVSRSMVRVASSAAGLQPGTNLMTPNQKNTTPSATRVIVIPWRAIHEVRRTSSGSSRAGSSIRRSYHARRAAEER